MQTVFQLVKYVWKYMTYNMQFSEQELNTVVNALAALPYRDSFALIGRITSEVQKQALAEKSKEFTQE